MNEWEILMAEKNIWNLANDAEKKFVISNSIQP